MKISVLGVGSELTSGQILNRNASWLSQKCSEMGLTTAVHLVVPDDRELIGQALDFCLQHSDLLFVTGGLGPTSDDFTREVLAQWCGKKLIWHEPSWQHIHDRLTPRGIEVRDIQKQQCYFPEGAQVLNNQMGTANGFCLQHQDKQVFVLPGPPKEIECLWQDHLEQILIGFAAKVDPLVTLSWDTIGCPESEIAELAEQALAGCAFERGYRVHLPYVEFKVSFLKSQSLNAEKWRLAVESALGAKTVLRQGQDIATILSLGLLKTISQEAIWICDETPGSYLMTRLVPHLKNSLNFITDSRCLPKSSAQTLILHLSSDGLGSGQARFSFHGQKRIQIFSSPYSAQLLRERENQYFAEMAMIFWQQELDSFV